MTLDGLSMYVSSTAADGVVNSDTRLRFHQRGELVIGRYRGGNVERGVLVGRLVGATLTFRYAQRERDGLIQGGLSRCDVQEHAGRIRIIERFEWSTRVGSGINIFDEAPDAQGP